jgi:hypothetical protein
MRKEAIEVGAKRHSLISTPEKPKLRNPKGRNIKAERRWL